MKIVIDDSIPFINGLFEPYADVLYKTGDGICRNDIKDADAMIIRTRTKCNKALLEGTSVKILSTVAIGTDNIDIAYCRDKGIFVQNASGCNAGGVMNYVCSALFGAAARKSIPLDKATFGIIGCGASGERVANMARSLGFKILICDPPRAETEGGSQFCDLDFLLRNSDIVSLHCPLNKNTRGMADAEFFSQMKLGAFFINTARGEIVVDQALIDAIPKLGAVAIDTWNNEPDINLELLDKVDIATPHIAGYSYQGKLIGSSMAVRAVARFLGIKELFDFFPAPEVSDLNAVSLDLRGLSQGQIASAIQYNYPIFTDDFLLRINPGSFAQIRSEYHYRREFIIA